jgi:hypothetical protein
MWSATLTYSSAIRHLRRTTRSASSSVANGPSDWSAGRPAATAIWRPSGSHAQEALRYGRSSTSLMRMLYRRGLAAETRALQQSSCRQLISFGCRLTGRRVRALHRCDGWGQRHIATGPTYS